MTAGLGPTRPILDAEQGHAVSHGVDHGYQKSLALWIGRFREAQATIQRLEDKVEKLEGLAADLAELVPEEELARYYTRVVQSGHRTEPGESG